MQSGERFHICRPSSKQEILSKRREKKEDFAETDLEVKGAKFHQNYQRRECGIKLPLRRVC